MRKKVSTGLWIYAVLALLVSAQPSLAAASSAQTADASPPVVTELRVGDHRTSTRFVLGLTQPVAFSVFTLADPYRVVVDLPEVGWRLPALPLPEDTGLLKRLRYGLFKPGVTRVVLDTSGPVAVTGAMLLEPDNDAGYRLVVDLGPMSAAEFASAEGRTPVEVVPASASQPAAAVTVAATKVAFPPPPRKPQPALRPALRVVAIDPGHGGVDPGTIGSSGIYEKHITLSMARELKAKLEATGRYKVVLTRDRDVFIRLRDRVEIARKAGAELFISMHADAIKDKKVRGLSVYTLSEKASDREAAVLAEKENKADLIAGINLADEPPEVANILLDLAQRETMNQSGHFAAGMVSELAREVSLLRNTHRFAGFAVLKAPDIPSVLVELGFLSNAEDERNLRNKAYRAKLAAAAQRAVDRYFARVEEASRP